GLGNLRTGKDQVVASAPVDAATPTVKASGASAQKPQDLGLASVQDQLAEQVDAGRSDFAQRLQGVVRGSDAQDLGEDRALRSGAQKSDDSPKSINSFFNGGSLLGPLPTAPTPPVILSGDVEQKPRS